MTARTLLVAGVLAAFPPSLPAQSSAIVDEGTFVVLVDGAPIGRESFRIVRTPAPGGQVFRATSTISRDSTRVTTSLGTDSTGIPVLYESEVFVNGRLVDRRRGRGRPGRFTVLAQTQVGESAREYVLTSDAILLDEDVAHHMFFARLRDGADAGVIAPRSTRQVRIRVESRGTETIEIGGRSAEARKFVVVLPDADLREMLIDSEGRVLRVSIPARKWVALRDELPR